jgi:uncharacterized protein (TIGR02001 family)
MPAHAQLSFSGSLESEYRFRGVSLSNSRPVVSVSAAYDHPSGAYAGVSALGQDTAHDGLRTLGFLEYAGYAIRPTPTGPSFDIGVDNENLSEYTTREYRLAYTEVYAGASYGGVSSHVYYSPDYFKSGAGSIYIDLNSAYRLNDDWQLTAHGGVSTPMGRYAYLSKYEHYDLRFGVSRRFRNLEAQVAWTGGWPGPQVSTQASRPAVVAGVSAFF